MLTQPQWDKNDPTDKTRWNSQHDTLKHLDPPYVYNVFKGDKEGFVNAVVDASSHPIERYVRASEHHARFGS
jgi:alcohol dehydrogenase YqhD (iron-dependent ADH family)